MRFPIDLKFAVFAAVDRIVPAERLDFRERGATVRPGPAPVVVYWTEGNDLCGDVYDRDARQVGTIRVPIARTP